MPKKKIRYPIETRNAAGELHSFNDEPAWIDESGFCRWFENGLHHRINKPAIVSQNGYKHWYVNGKHHCENGPAIVVGPKETRLTNQWFWNGAEIK